MVVARTTGTRHRTSTCPHHWGPRAARAAVSSLLRATISLHPDPARLDAMPNRVALTDQLGRLRLTLLRRRKRESLGELGIVAANLEPRDRGGEDRVLDGLAQ